MIKKIITRWVTTNAIQVKTTQRHTTLNVWEADDLEFFLCQADVSYAINDDSKKQQAD